MATYYTIPPLIWRCYRGDWFLFTKTKAIETDTFILVSTTGTYQLLRNLRTGLSYETKYLDRLQPTSHTIYRRPR